MTELELKIERLMGAASELVGFSITADTFRKISPEQATQLLGRLGADPDFRELALTRGSPIAEANLWLSARQSGADLPLEEVSRMAQGLSAKPENDDNDQQGSDTAPAAGSADARARLDALRRDPEWAAKALTRGTPEARENLELNAQASGATLTGADLARMADGFGPSSLAPCEP